MRARRVPDGSTADKRASWEGSKSTCSIWQERNETAHAFFGERRGEDGKKLPDSGCSGHHECAVVPLQLVDENVSKRHRKGERDEHGQDRWMLHYERLHFQ